VQFKDIACAAVIGFGLQGTPAEALLPDIPSTTDLSATPTITLGQTDTLTVTVTGQPGDGAPTGLVEFSLSSTVQ
jgi:hypothetical protein